jgi:hypothetical protein
MGVGYSLPQKQKVRPSVVVNSETVDEATREFTAHQCSFQEGSYVMQCILEGAMQEFLNAVPKYANRSTAKQA